MGGGTREQCGTSLILLVSGGMGGSVGRWPMEGGQGGRWGGGPESSVGAIAGQLV